MKKKVIAMLTVLIALLCLAACSGGDTHEQQNATESAPQEIESPKEDAVYTIESAIGDLTYPEKWKGSVRTESEGSTVVFYGAVDDKPEQRLFSIEYGESVGYLLGNLNGTDVYIIDGDFDFDDSWTNEEKDIIYEMAEDFNVILQAWMEDDGFTLAKNEP